MKTKLLSIAMATLMLLGSFVGCKESKAKENEDDVAVPLIIDSEYTIVRGDTCDEFTTDAAITVRNRLNEALSLNLVLKGDFLMKDEQPSEKEIVIGKTNRDTEFDRTTLNKHEYKVIVEGKKIIIDAYDSITLRYAVKDIMDKMLADESLRNEKGELMVKPSELEALSSSLDIATRSIKVMSQNIRCANDPDGNSILERSARFRKLINEYYPDVIGTQEATEEWNVRFNNMFSQDYGIYTGSSRDGHGVTTGEYGTILYKKDRFELVRGGTFWLSDTPDVKSQFPESAYTRICTYVVLKDKNTNTEILVANVHLDGGAMSEKQLKVMGSVLAEDMKKYPTFLTGDFNAYPTSETYKYASEIMNDAYTTALDNKATIDFTAHDYGTFVNKNRIDWCFYSKELLCTVYNTLTNEYGGHISDHYAIMAEIVIG